MNPGELREHDGSDSEACRPQAFQIVDCRLAEPEAPAEAAVESSTRYEPNPDFSPPPADE